MDLTIIDNKYIDGYELIERLNVKDKDKKRWLRRIIKKYDFEEGADYIKRMTYNERGGSYVNYLFTLGTAKEICLVSNSKFGKFYRRYLIKLEEVASNESKAIVLRILNQSEPNSVQTKFPQSAPNLAQTDLPLSDLLIKLEEVASKQLPYYNNPKYSECISDICCRFKELTADRANKILLDEGIISKRILGYFPNNEYEVGNYATSCYTVTCDELGELDKKYYVRYTYKGIELVKDLLVQKGYELK